MTESGRALLHDALAADDTEEGQEEELAWTQARACLERLQSDHRKRHIADLRARVKVASREGRTEEAMSLAAELDRMGRERAS